MSDVKDAVKLIDGPGRYLTLEGSVAVIDEYAEQGKWAIGDDPKTGEHGVGWNLDGTLQAPEFRRDGLRIVRRMESLDDDSPSARIASLEALNAALQTELDSLRAIMDSEHETFLQELILTAYGNAPFGTDHAKVVADAKAMLRTMEGGAV